METALDISRTTTLLIGAIGGVLATRITESLIAYRRRRREKKNFLTAWLAATDRTLLDYYEFLKKTPWDELKTHIANDKDYRFIISCDDTTILKIFDTLSGDFSLAPRQHVRILIDQIAEVRLFYSMVEDIESERYQGLSIDQRIGAVEALQQQANALIGACKKVENALGS